MNNDLTILILRVDRHIGSLRLVNLQHPQHCCLVRLWIPAVRLPHFTPCRSGHGINWAPTLAFESRKKPDMLSKALKESVAVRIDPGSFPLLVRLPSRPSTTSGLVIDKAHGANFPRNPTASQCLDISGRPVPRRDGSVDAPRRAAVRCVAWSRRPLFFGRSRRGFTPWLRASPRPPLCGVCASAVGSPVRALA